jgi:hypothetical protein
MKAHTPAGQLRAANRHGLANQPASAETELHAHGSWDGRDAACELV